MATSILVGTAVVASLAPSLLPRSSVTQAVVTGVLAALALLMSAALGTMQFGRHRYVHPYARRFAAAAAGCAVLVAVIADAHWQNDIRSAMGVPRTSGMHWVEVTYGSVSVCAILIVVGVGISRGARALGRLRFLAVLTVMAVGVPLALAPVASAKLNDYFAASDSAVDGSLHAPTSSTRSGSAQSLTPWNELGREGRKFASGGESAHSIRTYVGLDAAPTVEERASIAVDELGRADGFARSHIVVAVPTGSGWVDENAMTGIEQRFAGDVATVAVQYSIQPSWATFLFAKSEAKDSAAALLGAVNRAIERMPQSTRPEVFVYGQSLGSIGGSAAVAHLPGEVCGALWAGPPAGEVAPGDAVVVANSSDPVVRWSTELLWSRPDLRAARVDAPMPAWIPVVSYVQTTVDMVSALGAPAGHGHRYGTDQGTRLPDC